MASLKAWPKFPHWLLAQRRLKTIYMLNTSISDTTPTSWFVSLISQAQMVDLSNNDINGELSSIAVVSHSLVLLSLSSNCLSGKFPAFICNLTLSSTLVLSNYNFSGELPQCLENLIELQGFDVMNNSFPGVIPVSLGSLRNLFYLNLHNNRFEEKNSFVLPKFDRTSSA